MQGQLLADVKMMMEFISFFFGRRQQTCANHAQVRVFVVYINFHQEWWPKIIQAEFAGKPFVEVVPLDLVSPETSNFFAVPRAEALHFWENFLQTLAT